ncbi:MAG TPA: hypothetical protein VFJ82_02450 [Longimicrobium sp.]|nr:hypothetical protein [Longimicrobium sp.]
MPTPQPDPRDTALTALQAGRALVEALRDLPFQYSGCYQYSGGASARAGRGFKDRRSGQSIAALRNPLYNLRNPVYLDSPHDYPEEERADDQLRFTLGIDIDGTDPLDVVSGTVAWGPAPPGGGYPHFIGRVTSNEASNGGRSLVVQDFRFRWPESSDVINRLRVELTGSPLLGITAQVTFLATQPNREYGPFTVRQASTFFREVEMEVDREVNAVDVEPFSTDAHPDRPADLPAETLTLESAFARAGIRITRPSDGNPPVDSGEAGEDRRWTYAELHDSMQLHWSHFANKPQWKMWIFLAELAESDSLGGVMFDGEIAEPGGVDRQGTAIFTRCPYFHTVGGGYIQANPPFDEAVRRELFFNLIHETGHAFNLAHSFQKEEGGAWSPPNWMPLASDNQALSWMNYPDQATPSPGAGANATWFYRRFRWRFDDGELLFMRHAPETYVEMGGESWFSNHGRIARISVDPRLELRVRSRKQVYQVGEPVLVELRLRNVSDRPVTVNRNLDPSDGLVEVAVTNPRGERRPFLPVDHTRNLVQLGTLQPEEAVYGQVDLTMGVFGFPFKEPGAYRIEASYANLDGGRAAAVMQILVEPPSRYGALATVGELFNARVGVALYVDGTRVMDDVNDKLIWVRDRLDEQVGPRNPVSVHLTTVRYKPLARRGKVIDPDTDTVRVYDQEPDEVIARLGPVLEEPGAAADTMGHIWYEDVVDTYTRCAEDVKKYPVARDAQQQMLALFKERGVVGSVVDRVEKRVDELTARCTNRKAPRARKRGGAPDAK